MFRESIAGWMNERGVACRPSEVLVLSGSQQGLDLAARLFLDPGDAVVVDEPTYFGALQAFRGARARILPVPSDERGMVTEVLATVLERQRPKLIYTLPTYKNPAGTVMSLARRRQLLELAARYQIPVLEDDPYSELHFSEDTLPSLKALDEHGVVIYLSTFSKILFPGLRLGWLVAPETVIRQFALMKQRVDLHSDTPGQWAVDGMIRGGELDEHVEIMRRHYARRAQIMHQTLLRCAPEGTQWERPEGGFYVWCRLPPELERSRLLNAAAEAGVSFLPGWYCYVEDPGTSFIRLNFSFPREDQIEPGVTRLMEAVTTSTAGSRLSVAGGAGTRPIV
jgi:DNA-binding transcriptional MocR family regulator